MVNSVDVHDLVVTPGRTEVLHGVPFAFRPDQIPGLLGQGGGS